jgi:hypothetical protein
MDLGTVAQWLGAMVSLCAFIVAVWSANSKRHLDAMVAVKEAGERNTDRLNRHETRIASIEGDIRHLPDKDTLHRLEMSVGDLKAEMREIAAGVKPLASIVDRLNTFMMENK